MNKRQSITRKAVWGLLLIVGIGLLLVLTQSGSQATSTMADNNAPDSLAHATPVVGSRVTAMTSIGKMIVALIVVIACIYAGIYFLKRMMVKRRAAGKPDGLLEVIETTHLDARKSVALVRVADRAVLIGITEQNITMLTELDTVSTSSALETASVAPTDKFGAVFKSVTNRMKGLAGHATTTAAT